MSAGTRIWALVALAILVEIGATYAWGSRQLLLALILYAIGIILGIAVVTMALLRIRKRYATHHRSSAKTHHDDL